MDRLPHAAQRLLAIFLLVFFGLTIAVHAETFDFDGFAPGTLLGTQLSASGVSFPFGVGVIVDPTAPASGNRVLQTSLLDEFTRARLIIDFSVPQRSVALDVRDIGPLSSGETVTISMTGIAIVTVTGGIGGPTELPVTVDTDEITISRGDGVWHTLMVSDTTDGVERIEVETRVAGSTLGPNNIYLIADNLGIDPLGTVPPPPLDTTPPTVSFLQPVDGMTFTSTSRFFNYRIQAADDEQLATIHYTATHLASSTVTNDASLCGTTVTGLCPATEFDQSSLDEFAAGLEGAYSLTAEACDGAGNCTEASITVTYQPPTPSQVDLWIMGIEYNQGWQDVIYTDLFRGPEIGFVPVYNEPSGRDTELALNIVPGKPMVVRVYVGVRGDPVPPAGGVPVTGRLIVDDGLVGGFSRTLSPLDSGICSNHLGGGGFCRSVVRIFPSLGRAGFTTNSDYDLDFVSLRSTWTNTLNFVLPGEITERARTGSGLNMRAIVEPVTEFTADWEETVSADNEFRLELQNVATPNPLNMRLVRVRMPGFAAPSRAEADRALDDLLRLLLTYDSINVVSDREFFYDGDTDLTLNQCQTLWVRLLDAFSLDETNTLVALTPSGMNLSGCTGLGWRVFTSQTSAGAGTGNALGGIAISRMPQYTAALGTSDDWDLIGTLAQEVYHAHLDRRHVSNDHGEGSGCFITDETIQDIIQFVTGLDTDCYKPTVHPHGAIGSYPSTSIEVGVPGSGTGTRIGVMYGNLGAMGLRIERGSDWRLTLYDPCPTGAVSRLDPAASISQRVDPGTGRYQCTVSDDMVAHDFMSYGENPWFAIQARPVIKTFEAMAIRTSKGDAALEEFPQSDDPSFPAPAGGTPRRVSAAASALQFSGFLDGGGGFSLGPLVPSPNGTTMSNESSPFSITVTDAQGTQTSIPLAVGLIPPHHDSQDVGNTNALFFGTTIPAEVAPQKVVLTLMGSEIASKSASPNGPETQVLSPNGGETWTGSGNHTISWESADIDGDTLNHLVEYSGDGGNSWTSIGIVTGQKTMEVSMTALEASQNALVRVTTSDGMRWVQDSSDAPFSVSPAMASPQGKDFIDYTAVPYALTSILPSGSRPMGIGVLASGGNVLSLEIGLGPFSDAVDVYFGVFSAVLGNEVLLLTDQNTFQKASDGIVPWKKGVTEPLNENLFGNIDISLLPSGMYDLYLLVAPEGDSTFSAYYLWRTSFSALIGPMF